MAWWIPLRLNVTWGFPGGANGKEPACYYRKHKRHEFDPWIWSGRFPGEANGSPLQYSCPENPMDRGAWQATDHSVSKSQTWLKWLSTCTCHLNLNMAWMPGYGKYLKGCPGSEGDWWRSKILSYTCTLLFCYLTVAVEKLYSEIRLSDSLVHNAREQHKGWPSQSGQRRSRTWNCPSTAHPQPERSCGLCHQWDLFLLDLCIDLPLIESLLLTLGSFCRKKTLSTCFFWFSHDSHLGEEAEF